jgi:F5/8 type C domain
MTPQNNGRLRKRPITGTTGAASREPSHLTELDLSKCATVHFSSEDPAHPVENMLDGRAGSGATRWASARPDQREEIIFEFDEPQHISHVAFEAEEQHSERTQEVRVEFSSDGGASFRQAFIQEYNFSPGGSTYQCENLSVDLRGVTHLRIIIVPNKGGSGAASLTSFRLFS